MSFTLHCTRCEAAATANGRSYKCARCDRRLPVSHGVVWTSEGEPPPLLGLARYASERGWLAAAEKQFESRGLDARKLMTRLNGVRTERLGDWYFLVEPEQNGSALLLGDPWGAHMTALSRVMANVVVFEQDPEVAQYLRVRAEQASLRNLPAIVSGRGVNDFPFTREQFSLVALVGPWSSRASGVGRAETFQQLIHAAFRLLRKGGSLVIGIPNRLRLPFTLRNIGRDKIASTLPAFRAGLARSGFENLQFYLPFPDFVDYNALVSLDSREALRYFHVTYTHPRARWKRVVLGAAIDSGLVPVVAPSYIATAVKP